jgi:release factor glutamine methyltransferase
MNTTNRKSSRKTSGLKNCWTPDIAAILGKIKSRLQHAGIEEPELATEILIGSVLNCPRLELNLRLDEKPTPPQVAAIEEGCRRLSRHEPIQYVLGKTDFMGHVFKCDSRALIPRPETEELVEFILGYEPLWRIDNPSLIDIGTGTGGIVISLALRKKKAKYRAVDISADAIALAKENARANGVWPSIKFINADFTAGKIPSGLDAVVANPPYVRTADFPKLGKNIRLWEPRLALDGGRDGLKIIRPLIKKAFEILAPGRFLFLEIGFDQWPAVRQLLARTGFRKSFCRRDQSGKNRMVLAVK